jgi:hypothetical protein
VPAIYAALVFVAQQTRGSPKRQFALQLWIGYIIAGRGVGLSLLGRVPEWNQRRESTSATFLI